MDDFVNKIFKNKIFDKAKMKKFGFKKSGRNFVYSENILNNQFEFYIQVIDTKNIETHLTDTQTKDIYTLHLVEDAAGTFVGEVRDAYKNMLEKIAQNCCNDIFFIFPQSNRLAGLIKEKYGDLPEFLWEKSPGFGVFRNPCSKKWYGLISNIDKSKIDKKSKGEVEILNIKLDKECYSILKAMHKSTKNPSKHVAFRHKIWPQPHVCLPAPTNTTLIRRLITQRSLQFIFTRPLAWNIK